MMSFIALLGVLFLLAVFTDGKPSFGKDKLPVLKSILALLIVLDHLTFWVSSPVLQPFRKWGAPIVAIFLFISGYGLMKSYSMKGDDYLTGFGRKRLLKVLLPALVALVFYWVLCFDPSRNFWKSIEALLVNGIPLFPYSWYVVAIVVLYVSFWLSFKVLPMRYKPVGVVVLSILYMLVTVGLGYDRCWWVGTLAFPTGIYYAKYEERLSSIVFKSWISYALSVTVCFVGVAFFYVLKSEYFYSACYIFIPSLVVLILSKLDLGKLKTNKVVIFLSSISYEIYLCQGIAMELLRPFVASDALFIIAVYVLIIIMAFAVNRVASFLLSYSRPITN